MLIKFIAPNKEEIPAKWIEKIPMSTAGPEWAAMALSGGYKVHPVPTPPSTRVEVTNKINEGTRSQKLALFSLGKAISGAPIIRGTNQFPNPPISIGITKKNSINKP